MFVAYALCYWEKRDVCVLRKTFEKDCMNRLKPWLKDHIVPSHLAETQMLIKHSLAIQGYQEKNERFTWLSNEIDKEMAGLKERVKEPIFNQMERLTDENIEEVITLMTQPDIWGVATYSSQSLFNRLDICKFCQSVRKLNNRNKMRLAEALAARYGQNYGIGDYKQIFGGEVDAIADVRSKFENYMNQSNKMTHVAYKRLIEPFNYALDRLYNNK